MAQHDIKDIVIVGGGTAGWLTANIIAARFCPDKGRGLHVTLVESPNVPTVGVGEGTWPSMRTTLKDIGIAEADFIRSCDASLKPGTCLLFSPCLYCFLLLWVLYLRKFLFFVHTNRYE